LVVKLLFYSGNMYFFNISQDIKNMVIHLHKYIYKVSFRIHIWANLFNSINPKIRFYHYDYIIIIDNNILINFLSFQTIQKNKNKSTLILHEAREVLSYVIVVVMFFSSQLFNFECSKNLYAFTFIQVLFLWSYVMYLAVLFKNIL